MTDELLKIALLVPGVIAFFWFVELIFSSGENVKAKKHLAFFMLCGFISMYGGYIYFTGMFELYSISFFVIITFSFAQLAAFYLYLKSLIQPTMQWQTYAKHYFIPLLAGIVAIYFHYIWLSLEESARMFEYLYSPDKLSSREKLAYYFEIAFRNIYVVIGIFYLVIIHRQVKSSFKKLLNICVDVETKNPGWISIANMLYLFVSIFALVLFNLRGDQFQHFRDTYLVIPFLSLGVLFFLIGFKGNRQEMIAIILKEEVLPPMGPLPEDVKTYLKKNLETAMERDQLFLKQDICLPDLAKHIGTNRYYLSKLINSVFEINFNDYINRYRIQTAVDLIKSNNGNISLAEIATKSGFKSYISFSRNFKRQVKISPETFLKSHLENEERK